MSMSVSPPSSSPSLAYQRLPLEESIEPIDSSRESSPALSATSGISDVPVVNLPLLDEEGGGGTLPLESPRAPTPPGEPSRPADPADGRSVFEKLLNWAKAHVDYVCEGYRRDSALGNRMIGGLDAPLPQQVFGSVGKVAVVTLGAIVRATGLAKLARWGLECAFGFARWVVRGCISCAKSLGTIVADEVIKKATDQRNMAERVCQNTADQFQEVANNPHASTGAREIARVAVASANGKLGAYAGQTIYEAVTSDDFQESLQSSVKAVRQAAVGQTMEAAKPYAYAGAAAAAAGLAASLYCGNTAEIASGMVVAVGSAAIGTASYYIAGSGQGTSVFSRLSPANWLGSMMFPTPEGDDDGESTPACPVSPHERVRQAVWSVLQSSGNPPAEALSAQA